MHTKKQNMTKPSLHNIETEISKVKNSIIHFLLPIATQATNRTDTKNHSPPSHPHAKYSDMVRKHTTHSTIVVQPPKPDTTSTKTKVTPPDIINRITEHISQNNLPATIQKTSTSNNDKIIIKFNKTDDVETIADELRSQLGLNAHGQKPFLPKMTISHIPAHIDPKDNLRAHIIQNNPFLTEPLKAGQLDILFTYKTRDFSSAVIKTTPNVRSAITTHKAIIIGSRACPVRDRVQPQRCTQCCSFGHSKRNCHASSPTCAFCASDHESTTCPHKSVPDKLCCSNCKLSSKADDYHHTAFDKHCPLLQREIKKMINNTDYGSDSPPQFWLLQKKPSSTSPDTSLPEENRPRKIAQSSTRLPTIAVLNVCSLKKVNSTNQKACSLLALDIRKLNIDLFIVTETFLRSSIPDSYITIDGFDLIRLDRKVCKCKKSTCTNDHKGGGVLIYARSQLNCVAHEAHSSLESLWVKGSVPDTNNCFFVNASYHPPKNIHSPLADYLAQSAANIMKQHPHSSVFIGGDFNKLDLSDLLDEGLVLLHTPPTRKDATLDLLLTNRTDLIDNTNIFTPSLHTDHLGIIMFPKIRIAPIRSKVQYRDFSRHNKMFFSWLLLNHDLSYLYTIHDANLAAEELESLLHRLSQVAFPLKTITMSDKDPHWITPKIKAELIAMKKIKAKNGKTQKYLAKHSRIGKQKLNYLNKIIGSKDWWKEIDQITHRKHSNKTILASAFDGDMLNMELAERSRLSDPVIRQNPPEFKNQHSDAPQINIFDVGAALRKCQPTSPGPIEVPYFVFRDYWEYLTPLYHHIWNLSLSTSTFPTCYKTARLTAIPKTTKANSINDIRGISVTPISARIFEKLVHKRWILPHICTLGDPLQFAYKPSYSTADCLVTLQHHILSLLDKPDNDGVHAITVDFAKAFDKLDQHIAATKFNKFIPSSKIQEWLFNFSVDRSQGLYFNNTQYPQIPIHTGCSQGTVGGPNIFSMFTDDLRATHNNCSIIKYSDDSTLLSPCSKTAKDDNKKLLCEEVKSIQEWSSNNNLLINPNKTKHLRFCLNKRPSCSCKLSDIKYETVQSTTILGIHFQADCSFRLHRKKLLATLRSYLYIIRDLRHKNKSQKEIDTVFNALIISRVRYGIATYASDIKSLEKIHTFLERCHEKGYTSIKHSAHRILEQEDFRLTQNILKNSRHPLHDYITRNIKHRQTRLGFTTTRPVTRTLTFHRTFCNRILPL